MTDATTPVLLDVFDVPAERGYTAFIAALGLPRPAWAALSQIARGYWREVARAVLVGDVATARVRGGDQ